MRHRTRIGILAVLAAIFLVGSSAGWNKAGHMVSGAIAYDILKRDNPTAAARVVAILKAHPQFEDRWAKFLDDEGLSEEEKEQRLFMMAARWPDDIRGNDTYDRPQWHYINFPYKPTGQPATVRTKPPDQDANILKAFELNMALLRDRTVSDANKAVAICWVFHLVGDVHQPLHVVTQFSTGYPSGDRGGTRFYIRVKEENTSVISLHEFWDDLIIGSDRHQGIRNRAILLRNRPELAQEKLTELAEKKFVRWAAIESLQLAKEVVYRDGRLSGGTSKTDAPALPEDYPSTVKPVAERRIVLSGYRLAWLMGEVFGR